MFDIGPNDAKTPELITPAEEPVKDQVAESRDEVKSPDPSINIIVEEKTGNDTVASKDVAGLETP